MAFSTYVGDTGTPWQIQLNYSSGPLAHPNISGLTSAYFTIHLYNGTTTIVCANLSSIAIVDGINAIFTYQPLSTEVVLGNWNVWVTLTLPGGPKTFTPDSITVLQKY